jgi:alkanesulfonate monooxygenase SsuD/methylene tetrahydromethanopterin reductase-like flavin-dependent oxidoreductase (luciferase family)
VDIGLAMAVRNHPGRPAPLTQVYADYIDDAVYAEELGFNHVWVGEHRMTPCQWTPSPFVTMGAFAARTTNIRMAPGVLCLPFHNPLRVAEDLAVLDNISGGRIDFGFGVGSQFEEFRTFGIDPAERLGMTYESAAFIKRCLTEQDTFSHHGKHFHFEEVTFTQRPVQSSMPFYASAMGPKSVARAAEAGCHLIAPRQPACDEHLRATGRDPAEHRAILLQMVHVARTRQLALEQALEGLHYFVNFYTMRRDLTGKLPDRSVAEVTREQIAAGSLGSMGVPAVGTPDEVSATLRQLITAIPGTTGFALGFRHAGMRTPEVRESMRLFATEVMPHL